MGAGIAARREAPQEVDLSRAAAQLNVITGSAVGVSLAEMNWSARVDIPSSVAVTRRLATAERAPSGVNVSTGAGDV